MYIVFGSVSLECQPQCHLHLARGVRIGSGVCPEICTVGLGAIGCLKVSRIEHIEGLDAELQFARIRPEWNELVQREIELRECRAAQIVATCAAKVLTGCRY